MQGGQLSHKWQGSYKGYRRGHYAMLSSMIGVLNFNDVRVSMQFQGLSLSQLYCKDGLIPVLSSHKIYHFKHNEELLGTCEIFGDV